MARVRGKDTGPEMIVRRFLHSNGYRYRLHVRALPGCPDIVLGKYKTVIFVHGCFWHGHECKIGRLPKSNVQFWTTKIARNISRDRKNQRLLKAEGWRVITIWSCKLKQDAKLKKYIEGTLHRFGI